MVSRRLVALLDDDETFLRLARQALQGEFEVHTFSRTGELVRWLEREEPDLLLLDLELEGEEDGFAVHRELRACGFTFPVILLTIHAGIRTTARSLAEGVPYLNKDERLDAGLLRREVGRAVQHMLLAAEVDHYRGLLHPGPAGTECPWPDTAAGRRVRERLRRFLGSRQPLLLAGARGTGKLTTAQWVHACGDGRPFYSLTARGRYPEDFERQLYGWESRDCRDAGAFGAAALGTVFIQGLEALPEDALERLRLAIESGSYVAVQGTRERRLTARIIASRLTPGRPWSDSLEGFWGPCTVELPPLRDRPDDLEFLARRLARAEGCPGGHGLGALAPADLEALRGRDLPGNVHDLRRAVLGGLEALSPLPVAPADTLSVRELGRLPYAAAHERFEVAYLREVASHLGRDVDAWMRHTCYARASVYRWLKRLEE